MLPRLRSPRVGGEGVASIGLSGQMHGLVALDDADRVLRPAILWNDQRTGEECVEERFGLRELVRLAGNRALPGFTAPKLLWLRKHEPDVYARIGHVLLPKDYVRLRLTGEHATDVADASGTLLFDVAARGWSDEVMDGLEIPRDWVPTALESPASPGRRRRVYLSRRAPVTRPQVRSASGWRPRARSPSCSGPQASSSRRSLRCRSGRTRTPSAAPCPDGWHAMGVMLSAAGSLGWLRGVVAPGKPPEAVVAEAEPWPPGVEGLIFLPYLAGERTPHVDPNARAAFAGLSLRHDRGALVRAVLEGVAFGLRDSLEPCAHSAWSPGPPGLRRRGQERPLAQDRRRPRVAAGAHRGRGRRGVRRGAPRRGHRRRLRRRPRGRRRDRAGS